MPVQTNLLLTLFLDDPVCDKKFQPCQTSPSVFPPNMSFGVEIMKFLIPARYFGIFASPTKGMDIFLFEMSMK